MGTLKQCFILFCIVVSVTGVRIQGPKKKVTDQSTSASWWQSSLNAPEAESEFFSSTHGVLQQHPILSGAGVTSGFTGTPRRPTNSRGGKLPATTPHKHLDYRTSATAELRRNPSLSSPDECARACREGEPPKICYYHFTLEYYTVLGAACQVCTPNATNTVWSHCQCVLADGVERGILTANRMIPGPSIQVCEGDKVVVDVENLPNRRWGSFRHSGKRQLGSNALASFNSSGRSSICDTADDMYSDVSLEEDVHDLNHKLQILQQQVGVLTDSANHNDERYTRTKSENAALQARIHMLEEQLRETELRHEERLQDEVRRSRELISRVERDRSSQIEQYSGRIRTLENEVVELREEAARQRGKAERLEAEREEMCDQVREMRNEMERARNTEINFRDQERRLTNEKNANTQLIEELSSEVEHLRALSRTPALPTTTPDTLRLEELHEEMTALRAENQSLREANEELQANLLTAGVEQGILLTAKGETSLAAELEAMSHVQRELQQDAQSDLVKIQHALKEQQEVNAQLRSYIDGILLNIVENHPQLLEVKQKST